MYIKDANGLSVVKFEIKKRPHPNLPKYHEADQEIALKFAERCEKEIGEFMKAAVLFGSAVRAGPGGVHEHDIDVLMIVNDLTIIATPELISAYRVIVERLAAETSRRLHINTMRLTQFWEYARNGDPLLLNVLREGVPLYDTGFIEPMQVLLAQGRIRPTKEAVWAYYARSPLTLQNSQRHLLQASLDLYWAAIDAAHAALMHVGEMPGLPEQLPAMISQKLVAHKLCPKTAPDILSFFYQLQKDITRREKTRVSGEEYDRWHQNCEAFVRMMRKVIEQKAG